MDDMVKPIIPRVEAEVVAVKHLTPHMQRITVGGAALESFLRTEDVETPAAWVKVFLPSGEGRAYTIRQINRENQTLDLDFVLHHNEDSYSPASSWAFHAQKGERITLAGPRAGGFALPDDAAWVILAGDVTALPAIQNIAANLPATVRARVYVEVPTPEDQQTIQSPAALSVVWLEPRQRPGLALGQRVLYRPFPLGPGYVWVAGESRIAKELRAHYLRERYLERHRVRTEGYWKVGKADHREG
ncbi:siderophore-interacting protein [Alcaligenaceae bacterium 429]|uniref:siderophore-interacting protein n=1 Tax=Paenalcaligenes sp. Me52 TaxID=3392038 RepID=UPI0010927EA4|nr:siderophore-interacting protein [Alcaligenaceae bacterium 429]